MIMYDAYIEIKSRKCNPIQIHRGKNICIKLFRDVIGSGTSVCVCVCVCVCGGWVKEEGEEAAVFLQ